ncbi:MAG: class I SAM-dependent methyltransferase [Bdellovibrionota bacterium]
MPVDTVSVLGLDGRMSNCDLIGSQLIQEKLTSRVREFYQTFPYPRYPLLARPRFEEAYYVSSGFAKILANFSDINEYIYTKPSRNVLILGCGEILPYVISRIEPSSNHLSAVDISKKSINRARLRILMDFRANRVQFHTQDLMSFLSGCIGKQETFDHIDIYGVLHHLPNPSQALNLLSNVLHPGGTLRLMVYNNVARTWIYHLQKAFNLLNLSPFCASDRVVAKRILLGLSKVSRQISAKIKVMGPTSISNTARFVDTFFHVREARISLTHWIEQIDISGLRPYGIFDRYGELDDLNNPLWFMPNVQELKERIDDGRFENNFEMFLRKDKAKVGEFGSEGLKRHHINHSGFISSHTMKHFSYFIKLLSKFSIKLRHVYPKVWASFDETKGCHPMSLSKLWQNHQSYTSRSDGSFLYLNLKGESDEFMRSFSPLALKRLARIGAILPQMLGSYEECWRVSQPIHQQMDLPEKYPLDKEFYNCMRNLLEKERQNIGILTDKRLGLVMHRLQRAALA